MKKLFLISAIFFSYCCFLSAENANLYKSDLVSEESNTVQNEKKETFLSKMEISFFTELSPIIYLNEKANYKEKKNSAPSPIIFPFTFGPCLEFSKRIAFQPSLSFFMNEFLYFDGKALPSEIENRTATVFSFLLNVPAAIKFDFQKIAVQIEPGISVLARFGILSNNVKENDEGFSGNAKNDVSLINKYFWQKGRFFYLSFGTSLLFNLTEHLDFGPFFKIHISPSSFFEQDFTGTLFIFGGKIVWK